MFWGRGLFLLRMRKLDDMADMEVQVSSQRFKEKTVIVTGGASGIGLATATRLAREGARVAIFDINGEEGPKVERLLGGGARFFQVINSDNETWALPVTKQVLLSASNNDQLQDSMNRDVVPMNVYSTENYHSVCLEMAILTPRA